MLRAPDLGLTHYLHVCCWAGSGWDSRRSHSSTVESTPHNDSAVCEDTRCPQSGSTHWESTFCLGIFSVTPCKRSSVAKSTTDVYLHVSSTIHRGLLKTALYWHRVQTCNALVDPGNAVCGLLQRDGRRRPIQKAIANHNYNSKPQYHITVSMEKNTTSSEQKQGWIGKS